MKLKIAISSLVVCLLTACAAPKYNYRAPALDISEPPLNQIVKSAVGEEMLKQGKYAVIDILNVSSPIKPHWGVTINPGIFRQVGSEGDSLFFELGNKGGDSGSVEKSWAVDPLQALMVKKSDYSICMITVFNVSACSTDSQSNFKLEKRSAVFENSVQQTLIYNGKIGSRIKFGYREFSNNYARPAFNNDVEYDLSESKVVAYKGAQIEILEATNQYIKYIVRRNFNKSIGPLGPNEGRPNIEPPQINNNDLKNI